jgi:hypothetical protein
MGDRGVEFGSGAEEVYSVAPSVTVTFAYFVSYDWYIVVQIDLIREYLEFSLSFDYEVSVDLLGESK